MFVNHFKKLTDKVLPPIFFEILLKLKFTPNRLTLLSVISKAIVFYFFLNGRVIIGGVFIILDYVFDGLDGRLARYLKKATIMGSFCDVVADRGVRFSWFLALAYGGIISFELALIILYIESISYIITYFIEYREMKHIEWMPNVAYLLPYGALLNQLDLFLKIEIFLGVIILAIHIISIVLMNNKEKIIK